jgi:methyl-accepting chemotaxis protein|tara:strand:- start:981 stop:1232 length:252 start_codon:yes stop_codon:yes gene_type:complete
MGLNIVAAVEQQGAVPQEIASSVSRAASGTQEVLQNVAAASDASTMVSEEANSLLPSSNEMCEQPHRMHDEVLRFLQSVRRNQ